MMNPEFITYDVDGQLFGLDIMAIREFLSWTPIARLPRGGNLRGTALPVTDLAARLGRSKTEVTSRHAIIVTQIAGRARELIVDLISDIVAFAADALQPPPATPGSRWRSGKRMPLLTGQI